MTVIRRAPHTRRALVTIASVAAMLTAPAAAASAGSPASERASCVAVITSYEASQLLPGSIGEEVSGLAHSVPSLGTALVNPLAHNHLGSIETCAGAEG
jgi:hypothetical protein